MSQITGKVRKVETVNKDEFEKNVITIKPNQEELAFIECRGVQKKVSDGLRPGEIVTVQYVHEGSISKKGFKFNNLVATGIRRV